MTNTFANRIAQSLSIPTKQVQATLQLLNDGATIPFIARYRKEQTGELDEIQIESIQKQHSDLQEIEKRREAIIKSIEQ